jgi:transcriptional regulator with XRE-family HTH domain
MAGRPALQPNSPITVERKRLGLSRTELALIADVSQTHVGYWERGDRVPTRERLCVLATVFGVPPQELETDLIAFRERLRLDATEKLRAVQGNRGYRT